MASTTFNKINQFVQDQAQGYHVLGGALSATYKMSLSNTLTVATNHLFGDISANEIAAASGGYTAGGYTTTITNSLATNQLTVSHSTLTIAPTGSATIGPFQSITPYRSDLTTPVNQPIIGWYPIGASLTLNAATSDTYTLTDPNGFLTQQ